MHDLRHDESTGDLLMMAARALRRRSSAALGEYDVTPSQARALHAVAETSGLRLSALAERLRIAPRSATEVVDALEERGLVRREADPDDRRATSVVLTPEGRRLQEVVAEVRMREFDRLIGQLSAVDRADLDRLLGQLIALVEADACGD